MAAFSEQGVWNSLWQASRAEILTLPQMASPPQPIPVSRDIRVGNHDRLQMEAAISKIPTKRRECVSVVWGSTGGTLAYRSR